jgi:hypothetical protein
MNVDVVKFMDSIGDRLSITSKEDWYKVSSKDVFELGGSTVLVQKFGGSLIKGLKIIYNNL